MMPFPELSKKWHGVPLWGWYVGGAALGGVGFYFYRKRKAAKAAASPQPNTLTVGTAPADTADQGAGNALPGAAMGGGGSPFPPWFGDLFKPPAPTTTDTTGGTPDTGTTPGIIVGGAGQGNLIQKIADAGPTIGGNVNIPAAPTQPAPPPVTASVPDNWQANAGLSPAPPGLTAVPLLSSGSIVGENFFDPTSTQTTAPWQQAIGLAPAPAGQTATPIIVQGSTVGESFSGTPTTPAPYNVIDNPPPASDVRQSIFGPVTAAQWAILPANQRL